MSVPQLSDRAQSFVLLKVFTTALADARREWKTAQESPDELSLRAAYRASLFAARAARQAAHAYGHDAREATRLTAEAEKLDAAAAGLQTKLVKVVVDTAAHSS